MPTTSVRDTVREIETWVTPQQKLIESRWSPVTNSGHTWLGPRNDATYRATPRRSNPHRFIQVHPNQQCRRSFTRVLQIFAKFDLQLFPETTTFQPLDLLILVKDKANFINKVCSPINRLQTYYRIFGSKSSKSKDMARPNWLHSTVTISDFKFSFSYSTPL